MKPAITRVTVPSKWGGEYDTEKTGRAEFRLGLGPCGRTVTRIAVRWDGSPDRFTVRQAYTEGDTKDFVYLARDLTGRVQITRAKLAEAEPTCGARDGCTYRAPCIIGTIVPEGEREGLDFLADSSVSTLMRHYVIAFPTLEQAKDAISMQNAFDRGDWDRVLEIARPYVMGSKS